ncbi:MAG TPA: hypothetical protein VKS82_02550 [Streptosporangiaceae bacterium]|nr:hypothetical protein [Streptosporangiaceae bacterium]
MAAAAPRWGLPSGWPESEDTAVVLASLARLDMTRADPSIRLGASWLLHQQNRNGSWSEGIPGASGSTGHGQPADLWR